MRQAASASVPAIGPKRLRFKYIESRNTNLTQGTSSPYFLQLVGTTHHAYQSILKLNLMATSPTYARLLLICHKSLLSAAALIAEAQPDDSVAITRRAIETARTALAIKLNPENARRWLAYQERHERWLRRQEGEKRKHFAVQFLDVQSDALVRTLDAMLGMLSDAYVHFTPEYYSSLDWEVRRVDEENGVILLNYFHRDRREIERHFIILAASQGKILEAFDRCFDGTFTNNKEAKQNIAAVWAVGRTLNEEFHRRYSEVSGIEDAGVL